MNFRVPPLALTQGEKWLLATLASLVAVSRLVAVSKSLWDWDEALFALAVRDYDVTRHHPQPPGFPLFILPAKLIAGVGAIDEFRALQLLTVSASMLLFPAMWLLARELRAPRFVAVGAGLVLAFLPNVWLFGGTGLSDVPSLVLSLLASALLLRGCRSGPALIAGAFLLSVAAGVRPQNLMIGFVPAVIAFRCRFKLALIGALIGLGIIGTAYGWAAFESGGWSAYREAVSHHADYISSVDSFQAPLRPGLVQVADDFFLRPFRATMINIVWAALAAVSIVAKRRHVLLTFSIFGPFLLFAWLWLDFHSASRFSIAYMPLFAMLAAEGIDLLWRRVSGGAAIARTGTLAAFLAMMIVWAWPVLRVVRNTVSPPVAAIGVLRAGGPSTVYVDERLAAHAALLLPEYELRPAGNMPPLLFGHGALLLREGASTAPDARSFVRERRRLDGIVRGRYFETSIVPARDLQVQWEGDRLRATFPEVREAQLLAVIRTATACSVETRVDERLVERYAIPAGAGTERTWTIVRARGLTLSGDCISSGAKVERLAVIPFQ